MLYVGYPVSYKTACEILNEPYVVRFEKIYDSIKTRLAEYGLELSYYDKDVWILGMSVKELMLINDNYMQVSDALEIIMYYKRKVMDSLKQVGADLSEFNIEIMEGEPIRVTNPLPYVIT
jgi:hypothetical protein